MFRKATEKDILKISEIYNEIHTLEEKGLSTTGWIRSIYPTEKTARDSVKDGDMYVLEHEGKIVASARINKNQGKEYESVDWSVKAPSEEVLVMHTLAVSSSETGKGYGKAFMLFYEELARELDCPYLRIDTNEKNTLARSIYKKLGYREAAILPCVFNGIPDVNLVMLEKTLDF